MLEVEELLPMEMCTVPLPESRDEPVPVDERDDPVEDDETVDPEDDVDEEDVSIPAPEPWDELVEDDARCRKTRGRFRPPRQRHLFP